MVYLKLDLAKAYDKVEWDFLFNVMERIKVMKKFIGMVRLLFKEANVVVFQWIHIHSLQDLAWNEVGLPSHTLISFPLNLCVKCVFNA